MRCNHFFSNFLLVGEESRGSITISKFNKVINQIIFLLIKKFELSYLLTLFLQLFLRLFLIETSFVPTLCRLKVWSSLVLGSLNENRKTSSAFIHPLLKISESLELYLVVLTLFTLIQSSGILSIESHSNSQCWVNSWNFLIFLREFWDLLHDFFFCVDRIYNSNL